MWYWVGYPVQFLELNGIQLAAGGNNLCYILYVGDSEITGVGGIHRDIPKMTTDRRSPADVLSDVEIVGPNPVLIKAHGTYSS